MVIPRFRPLTAIDSGMFHRPKALVPDGFGTFQVRRLSFPRDNGFCCVP